MNPSVSLAVIYQSPYFQSAHTATNHSLMHRFKFLLIVCLLALPLALSAQSDPLGGKDTLVLENERIEDVIDSNKPFMNLPKRKITQGSTEEITYESEDFYVDTDFEPTPPKVKLIQKEKRGQSPRNNFVKVGFGRFLTPLVRLALHNGEDSEYDYGLDFTHLSSHGDIVPLREFREDYGDFVASYLSDDFKLSGRAGVYNTAYNNYADSLFSDDPILLKDSTRRGFTGLDLGAAIVRNYDRDQTFLYDVGFDFKLLNEPDENREMQIGLNPEVSLQLGNSFKLGLDATGYITPSNISEVNQNRTFAGLAPYAKYDNDVFSIKGGINYNVFKNSIDSSGINSLVPNIELSYKFLPEELTLFAGYTGGMQRNTYNDMIRTNRFIDPDGASIKPTIEKMNLFFGANGNLSQNADYNARLYVKRIANQLIFFSPDSGTSFSTLYDSTTSVFGTHIEANYNILKNLRAGAGLDFNAYNTSTVDEFYHATPFVLNVNGAYKVLEEKLTLSGIMNIFGKTPISQKN